MHQFNLTLAAAAAVVMLLGLVSNWLKRRSFLSTPLLAVGVGILLGQAGLGLLDPDQWPMRDRIIEEGARLTLAIALMGIALRLPPRFLFHQWKSMLVILGLVMPGMWLVSSLLSYWLLGLSLTLCFLIGAIVTPTDPVVASAITTGAFAEEHLPARLRHLLSAESGANDGLALMFVMLPILLLSHPLDASLSQWLMEVVVTKVMGAVVLGGIIGLLAGKLLASCERKHSLEHLSFLSFTVALALFTLGLAKLLHCNEILSVFVAGIAFDNKVGGKDRAKEAEVQESVNQLFTLPIFLLFGLILPLREWIQLSWSPWLLATLILLLRRLPLMLILRTPLLRRGQERVFVGWFGPIGISALFYTFYAIRQGADPQIWPVASLIIFASILVHGVTAAPVTRRYPASRGEHNEI